MYDHIGALVRGFGLGRGCFGETDRIVQALKPMACGVIPMSGEAKDHKSGWNQQEGPPKRPLCNGNIGANSAMGLLTFLIMRPIRSDFNNILQTSICSREELLPTPSDLNQEQPF